MDDEYLKKIINEIPTNNFLNKINNNLYLRDEEIKILEKNNIEYSSKNMESLIYELEEILNLDDNPELEWLSKELSERNYYENTKK